MTNQATPLHQVVLSFLIPLMLAAGITDTSLAAQAVQEAIAAYNGPLVSVAQIVGFAFTALDGLRLSVTDDPSLSMKLKLRANANALGRVSVQATKALPKPAQIVQQPEAEPAPEPEPIAIAEPQPVPENLPQEQQNRCHWANAMTRNAAELQARRGQVSPAQRNADRRWIEILTDVAAGLRTTPAPSGLSRAELLRTTLLSSSATFPLGMLKPKSPHPNRA